METITKPQVSFRGEDGNVFHLLGLCAKTLKAHGLKEEAKELIYKVWATDSYGAAIQFMGEYVEITWK